MSISGAVVTGEILVDVEFIAFTVGVGATEIELLTNVVPGADGTDVDVEDDDVEAKVDTVVIDAGAVVDEATLMSAEDEGTGVDAETKLVDASVPSELSELPDSTTAATTTAPSVRAPRKTAVASAGPKPNLGILEPF
jgi:hypothetical protein